MNRVYKNRAIESTFLILVPILSVCLLLIKYKIPYSDLSIFNSPWNDELSYYKQIEGITGYGIPKGYFGYNESKAAVGTLGPWSVALLIPYALITKFIGMGTYQIIMVNVVLSSITLFICSYILRLRWKANLAIALLILGYANFARYMLSVSPELLMMLCAVLLFACFLGYEKYSDERLFTGFMIILVYLTLARGYYAIYGLLAFFIVRNKGKKLRVAIVTAASAISYLLLVHFLCSPYFMPLINIDLIRMIWTSPVGFITTSIEIIGESSLEAINYCKEIWSGGSFIGTFYLLSFIIIALAIICGALKKSRMLVLSAICFLLMIISIWLLYDVRTGSRHLMASLLAITIAIFAEIISDNKIGSVVTMLTILMIAAVTYFGETDYDIMPPRADSELQAEIENAGLGLDYSNNGWDNTVIWTLSCDYRYLYAVPAGAGINICTDDYILDNINSIKSKYIAVDLGHETLLNAANERNWILVKKIGTLGIYMIS